MASSRSRRRALSRSQKLTRAGLVVLAVAVVALAVVALRGNKPATAGAAQIPDVQPQALFWGDSYFNGANSVSRLSTYAYLSGTQLGYNTVLGGHGGTGFYAQAPAPDRTPNYLRQLAKPGVLNGVDPALVVVEGGINDGSAPAGAERANAIKVLDLFKGRFPKAKIVVVGPASPTGSVTDSERRVIDELRAAATDEGLPFIDESGWINAGNVGRIIGSDGTHPSGAGHLILSGYLTKALARYRIGG